MGALATSLIVLACVFGGALFGMILRTALPAHHLSEDTKDIVKLGMGLVSTMTALVLGLLVASTKGSYDTQKVELTQMSTKIIFLDRLLAHYGPETKEIRNQLHGSVARELDRIWPEERAGALKSEPGWTPETIYDKIQELSPTNDAQRSLKAQALSIATDLGQMRWLMYEQGGSSFSMVFLVVVVSWTTIIFISIGLFAPRNATVIVTFFVCALSVSGAILLILELDRPFDGLIQISSVPLRNALALLGR